LSYRAQNTTCPTQHKIVLALHSTKIPLALLSSKIPLVIPFCRTSGNYENCAAFILVLLHVNSSLGRTSRDFKF